MSYGMRYLRVSGFIKFCKDANIHTDETELEYYEEQELMMPTARTKKPEKLVNLEYKLRNTDSVFETDIEKDFKEYFEIFERSLIKRDYTEDEIIDSFDKSIQNNNPFINIPIAGKFEKWETFKKTFFENKDFKIRIDCAETYYSYWQIYQLYLIKQFPDLYENRFLLTLISEEEKERSFLPRCYNKEIYRTFHSKSYLFNALSFFIVMYQREQERTFFSIPDNEGIKSLNEIEYSIYSNKIEKHGKYVMEKFKLEEKDIFDFLVFLIDLKTDYEKQEKYKLSKLISKDIENCATFITSISGLLFEEIVEKIGRKPYTIWKKKALMQLDIRLKYVEKAKDALSIHYKKNKEFYLTKNFHQHELDDLIDYCVKKDLITLLYSLDQFIFYGSDELSEDTFMRRYLSILTLATSFEFLLSLFPKSKNSEKHTLKPYISDFFSNEPWVIRFKKITYEKNGWELNSDFSSYKNNYIRALSEDDLDLRNILLAYIARNLFIHNFPNFVSIYNNTYGNLFSGLIHSIINTYIVARNEDLL